MRILSLLTLISVLSATPVAASSFLAMSQEELVASSSAVVQGKVVETRSYWNEDRSLIWTEAVIAVEERLVGEAPGLVRVQTPGGKIGDIRIEAVGFPTFADKERLIVFLEPEGERTRVTGFRQGQWRIETGEAGQEIAVPAVDSDVLLVGRDGRPVQPPAAVALETLKQTIRDTAMRVGSAGR